MIAPRSGVGIIGAGNMGGGMARNLLARGYMVHVRDIDRAAASRAADAGATVHDSAAAIGAACDRILIVVVDAAQIDTVLFGAGGLLASLDAQSRITICSTIGPADVERFGVAIAERGAQLIDAPISGGPSRALTGSMSMMVACSNEILEQERPLLDALASRMFHVGERLGDAARAKLINNLLAGINLAAAAEAFALAERMGLDTARLLQVVGASSGQSWICDDRLPRALDGDFAPRAHTRILLKDIGLALACAAQAGSPAPLGEQAQALFRQACEMGLAEQDDGAVLLAARRNTAVSSGTSNF